MLYFNKQENKGGISVGTFFIVVGLIAFIFLKIFAIDPHIKRHMINYNLHDVLRKNGGKVQFGEGSYLILEKEREGNMVPCVEIKVNGVVVERKRFSAQPHFSKSRVRFLRPWGREIERAVKKVHREQESAERKRQRDKKRLARQELATARRHFRQSKRR